MQAISLYSKPRKELKNFKDWLQYIYTIRNCLLMRSAVSYDTIMLNGKRQNSRMFYVNVHFLTFWLFINQALSVLITFYLLFYTTADFCVFSYRIFVVIVRYFCLLFRSLDASLLFCWFMAVLLAVARIFLVCFLF